MATCCENHPRSCPIAGFVGLVAMIGLGFGFGWRWLALFLVVSCELDWLIRVWKHQRGTA